MKKRIIHFKKVDPFWDTQSACKQLYSKDPDRVTTSYAVVTCKNCLKMDEVKQHCTYLKSR